MKIKIWLFVLIVAVALVIGAGGMFVGLSGVSLVGHVIQDVQMVRPNVSVQLPNGVSGNGGIYSYGNNGGSNNGGSNGNGNDYTVPSQQVPALPQGLPQGFNAGVNIESEYAALTNRTVAQVQTAELTANTDPWGLAKTEGKLDQLKAKVTDDVTAALQKMVSDKKITQDQSNSYLNWVKQYLQTVGQTSNNGMMPGYGRGRGRQINPNATAQPGSNS